MKARLLTERPCYANEWVTAKMLKAGTIITITGVDENGRMTAERGLGILTVEQDQVKPL